MLPTRSNTYPDFVFKSTFGIIKLGEKAGSFFGDGVEFAFSIFQLSAYVNILVLESTLGAVDFGDCACTLF